MVILVLWRSVSLWTTAHQVPLSMGFPPLIYFAKIYLTLIKAILNEEDGYNYISVKKQTYKISTLYVG